MPQSEAMVDMEGFQARMNERMSPMGEKELRDQVLRMVLTEMAKAGTLFAPIAVSGRHAHLSLRDAEILFGPGYQFTPLRDLIQPGQFACREQVVLEIGRDRLQLRIVGPVRQETQVELTLTDSVKLGVRPPIRMSGDLEGSLGGVLIHEDRRVALPQGVIVAARHLHLSAEEGLAFGLGDGDVVELALEGLREAVLGNMIVRCGPGHRMEAHIDTDEANACGLAEGRLGRGRPTEVFTTAEPALAPASPNVPAAGEPAAGQAGLKADFIPVSPDLSAADLDLTEGRGLLLTEEDVRQAIRNGYRRIRCGEGAIVTPLARDTARDGDVELMETR
ncbi:MAG: PduL/EutD family phosphate acyltransferase [Clostridia bacterium]|nr:PduL/EutD family phosphate acyltransferase [Clostridia bacterium]